MLVLDGTEISGSYNITYNGTELKQIDVVKNDNRYTVWKKGGFTLNATSMLSGYPITVWINDAECMTISEDGSYALDVEPGDEVVVGTSVFKFDPIIVTEGVSSYSVKGITAVGYYEREITTYDEGLPDSRTYEMYTVDANAVVSVSGTINGISNSSATTYQLNNYKVFQLNWINYVYGTVQLAITTNAGATINMRSYADSSDWTTISYISCPHYTLKED